MKETSRRDIANSEASITEACNMLGMDVPELSFMSNIKLWCPFGEVSHADGGHAKAFRVYPEDNTAYCFACGLFFNPVRLIAMGKDISDDEAAEILLEKIGHQPEDIDERWKALMIPPVEVINQPELAEALKIYCARIIPAWEERQFDTATAVRLQKCLDLLQGVKSQADSLKWLSGTKQVMTAIIGEPREDQTD